MTEQKPELPLPQNRTPSDKPLEEGELVTGAPAVSGEEVADTLIPQTPGKEGFRRSEVQGQAVAGARALKYLDEQGAGDTTEENAIRYIRDRQATVDVKDLNATLILPKDKPSEDKK